MTVGYEIFDHEKTKPAWDEVPGTDYHPQPEPQLVVLAQPVYKPYSAGHYAIRARGWKAVSICGWIDMFSASAIFSIGITLLKREKSGADNDLVPYAEPLIICVPILVTAILALIAGVKRSKCFLVASLVLGIITCLTSGFSFIAIVLATKHMVENIDQISPQRPQPSRVVLILAIMKSAIHGATVIAGVVMSCFACSNICACGADGDKAEIQYAYLAEQGKDGQLVLASSPLRVIRQHA